MPKLCDVLPQVWERIALRMRTTQPMGLTTGIPDLDRVLGQGWTRQELTYLVGDSGVGKSWLTSWFVLSGARWLFEHPDERPFSGYLLSVDKQERVQQQVLEKEGKPPLVVFWSLEMMEMATVTRFTTQTVWMLLGKDLDSADVRLGRLTEGVTEEDFARAYMCLRGEWGKYIWMDYTDRTIEDFRETLDDLSSDHDIVLVVIDYFRRIEEFESEGNIAVAQEVRSGALSELAHYYDCHVLCVFDITRTGQRASRIQLSHMKGGTAAQYDADTVLVLNEHLIDTGRRKETYSREGLLDLEVAKNRFGMTGTIQLEIDRATGAIEPVSRGQAVKEVRNVRKTSR